MPSDTSDQAIQWLYGRPFKESVGSADAPFTLKDENGNGMGSFTGDTLTLTIVTSSAPIASYYCAIQLLDAGGNQIAIGGLPHSGAYELVGNVRPPGPIIHTPTR